MQCAKPSSLDASEASLAAAGPLPDPHPAITSAAAKASRVEHVAELRRIGRPAALSSVLATARTMPAALLQAR
jgi:hypothetical protein